MDRFRKSYFNLLYEAIIIVSQRRLYFNISKLLISIFFMKLLSLSDRKTLGWFFTSQWFQSSLWSYYHCQSFRLQVFFYFYFLFQSSLWSYYHCQAADYLFVCFDYTSFQSSLWSYYHCQRFRKRRKRWTNIISIFFMKLLSLSDHHPRGIYHNSNKFQSSLWSYYHCQGLNNDYYENPA